MSETRVFSFVLLTCAIAVGIGVSQLIRMLVRDIIEHAREDDPRDARWFE